MANGIDVGLVVLVFLAGVFIAIAIAASRYKKVPPNMAMVVYGKKQRAAGGRGDKVISGGAKIIVPVVESVQWLKLDVRTLDLVVNDIVTDVERSGAKINIKAVA